MKDEVKPWRTMERLEGRYFLKEFRVDYDQLVLLEDVDTGRCLTMRVESDIMYCRQLYGAARPLAWGGRDAPVGTFFVVVDSSVSEYLFEQSYGFFPLADLVHFRVAAENCVLDIVTGLEPEVVEGDLLQRREPGDPTAC